MNYISAHPDEFKIKDRMTVGRSCTSQIFWMKRTPKLVHRSHTIHILLRWKIPQFLIKHILKLVFLDYLCFSVFKRCLGRLSLTLCQSSTSELSDRQSWEEKHIRSKMMFARWIGTSWNHQDFPWLSYTFPRKDLCQDPMIILSV